MWETLNQRKFPRLNIKCDIEVSGPRNAFAFSTVTQNIGAGGVCVILPRELSRSVPVHLKLYLRKDQSPVECSGRVCWNIGSRTLFKSKRQFDTGIEFVDIPPEHRETIRMIVAEGLEGR
ncbi:MAG TPA: PilZ domain-containing protein [Candidatus Omnitrophota bacterium]|nr:PilZ domain-containing protein [Candidatus Omnitrophota bacterium]